MVRFSLFGTRIGTRKHLEDADGHPDPDGCLVKPLVSRADQGPMAFEAHLPVKAGQVPDRLTIWPVDDGRYGLDATFQGASGYESGRAPQPLWVRWPDEYKEVN